MPFQRRSKLERSVERALKEAHEAADSVGRNFMERLKVGNRRPFESVFFDPDNKRWKEPPKEGRFYIVGKFGVSVPGCGGDSERRPTMALRCRRGWSSDRSARVELRSFNHCQERTR